MAKGFNGPALAATAIGTLFLWSGIKGWSVLGTVQDVITGKGPSDINVNPVGAPASGTIDIGSGPGSVGIASVAQEYLGHAYKYGGAPGPNAENPWDCSSYCNFVIGVRLGLAIPGYSPGGYKGTSHGPATGNWGVWPGLQTITRQELQAGDLIVWTGHMGIALDTNTMISALNETTKTAITPIDGHGNGPLLRYGRVK